MSLKLFRWIRNSFTINSTFLYEGTRDEFQTELDELLLTRKSNDGFNAALDDARIYKISPAVSWGTMRFTPITVCLTYETLNSSIQKVNVYTPVRPEVLILVIVFPFLLISMFRYGEWSTLAVPLFLILCIAWFHFVSKMQERSLIKKIKSRLRLSDVI